MGIFTYIKIGALILLLSAIGAAYWYFNWSQNEMQVLRGNAIKLEAAVAQSEATIQSLQSSIKDAVARFTDTSNKFDEARTDNIALRDKLSKHELGVLAEAKPGLIENIINKSSADAVRCFEILSGSPLSELERAATKKSELNNSCPAIANPNYKERK